jgi:hypothetical protein
VATDLKIFIFAWKTSCMKINIPSLTVSLLLIISSAAAQSDPVKFGNVSLQDVQMTQYEKDTSAAAIILMDYGKSSLPYSKENGFSVLFERIIRIKILKKDGLSWGDFEIPLYKSGSSDEKVSGLKAITYNLEGGKMVETKLKNENVFKESVNKNRDVMKIALSNVKVGSVLEITYKVMSDFIFNFQDWQFQTSIPTVWSEYRARIPEYFFYDKYTQGYAPLSINEKTIGNNSISFTSSERSGGNVTSTTFNHDQVNFTEEKLRWVAENVPAFKAEPFIASEGDYISKINFELSYTKFPNSPVKTYMGNWEDINKFFSEDQDFYGQIAANGFLKRVVDDVIMGVSGDEQKIVAIENYVKNNILWDGTNTWHTRATLRKVFDEKKGSSGEINMILASMLEKAGFTVFPVLISTRSHGMLREHIPASNQFNRALCFAEAGGKQYLLDATDKLLPMGVLPESCLNGKGFVVSKTGFKWVPLTAPKKTKKVINGLMTLSSDGGLAGNLTIEQSGYLGHRARKSYFGEGEEKYVKSAKQENWEVSKSEFVNAKEINEIFKERHEVIIPDFATVAGDVIYINPTISKYQQSNPFKVEKREYPVDFAYPADEFYMIKLTIPDGYLIDQLPAPKAFVLPGNASKYAYNITAIGNTISIVSTVSINKALFVQDEYPNLREFFNQVVAKQNEQIVLKKKQ